MIRRLLESNLLEFDLDNPGPDSCSELPENVPNYSILSPATKGNIQTLAVPPPPPPPPVLPPAVNNHQQKAKNSSTSSTTTSTSSSTCSSRSVSQAPVQPAAAATPQNTLPAGKSLCCHGNVIDTPNSSDSCPVHSVSTSASNLLALLSSLGSDLAAVGITDSIADDSLDPALLDPTKLELASILSLLNDLSSTAVTLADPSAPPPETSKTPSTANSTATGPVSKKKKKKKGNQPAQTPAVPVSIPSIAAPLVPLSNGTATLAPESMAAVESLIASGDADKALAASLEEEGVPLGNHVWISASTSWMTEGEERPVLEVIREHITPFLENNCVVEYRFPHHMSEYEKEMMMELANQYNLSFYEVEEETENFVSLRKRRPGPMDEAAVEFSISQLEKQAKKTLKLVELLTAQKTLEKFNELKACVTAMAAKQNNGLCPVHNLPVLPSNGAPANGEVSSQPVKQPPLKPPSSTQQQHKTPTPAPPPPSKKAPAKPSSSSTAPPAPISSSTKKPVSAGTGGSGKQTNNSNSVTTGPVKPAGNQQPPPVKKTTSTVSTAEPRVEAKAVQISEPKKIPKVGMVDAGMQTCPEGWYVCPHCEQEVEESRQLMHRSACLAELRQKLHQRAKEAEKRRARRKNRQQGGTGGTGSDDSASSDLVVANSNGAEAANRARLDQIHDNDLDALLRTIQQIDAQCGVVSCTVRATVCSKCRVSYCAPHMPQHTCHAFSSSSTGASGTSASGSSLSANHIPAGPTPPAPLSYFERSQLQKNLKKKMAVLKERRK